MGEKRVELPSGGYAVFRDPVSVSGRERLGLEREAEAGLKREAQGERVSGTTWVEHMLALMLKEWSHPVLVPRDNPEALLDIPALDADLLRHIMITDPEVSPFLQTAEKPDPKGRTAQPQSSGDSDSRSRSEPVNTAPTSRTISASISS